MFDSLAQLLPSHHQDGASAASICQARNAYESFQVEVTAPATAATTIKNVTASSLAGPGSASIPAADVTISQEADVTLHTMSDGEFAGVLPRTSSGACIGNCKFPDELIPARDPLFKQARDAFPIPVPAGQNRAVWVDVFIPAGQAPGTYSGRLTIADAAGSTTVPVQLTVIDATLPSTSSVHSTFFASKVPTPLSADQARELAELGLDDRINVLPDFYVCSDPTCPAAGFQRLLMGTDPAVQLKGARLTDFPLTDNWDATTTSAYKTWLTSLHRGSLAWAYCDEVAISTCANYVNAARQAWPGLPAHPIQNIGAGWPDPNQSCNANFTSCNPIPAALAAATTAPIALAQYLDSNKVFFNNWTPGDRMPALAQWRSQAAGRQVWTYSDCESGGCDAPYDSNSKFAGWPSYGIDQAATEQRAMGWQLYSFGLNGELYYEVWENPDATADPYHDGVNGDGTLFYQGDPATIGGTSWIPLESIRLKRIRDGREDMELLRILQGRVGRAQVGNIARGLFPSMDQSNPSDAKFDATRQQVLDMLASTPSSPTAVTARTGNGQATVSWTAGPTNGTTLSGYTVTASPGGSSCTTSGATTCTVTGLTNNTPYTFTVIARSSSGNSDPSGASNEVVPVAIDSVNDLNCDGVSDFMAVQDGTGDLLYYPREKTATGAGWVAGVPFTVGDGYGNDPTSLTYSKLFFAGDMNGDGSPDVIGVTPQGAAELLPGDCTGHPGAPTSMGPSLSDPIGVGDFNGDGIPDVLSRNADGRLWLLPGTGHGTLGPAEHVTSGWNTFDTIVAAGDMNGDGHPDVIVRQSDGTLQLYESDGKGGWIAEGVDLHLQLPASTYPTLIGGGDFDGDGLNDLAAVNETQGTSQGNLMNFAGAGETLASSGKRIGGGWDLAAGLSEIVR